MQHRGCMEMSSPEVSDEELFRRWARLQRLLEAENLDALVIHGGSDSAELIYATDVNYRGASVYFALGRGGDVLLLQRGGLGYFTDEVSKQWRPTYRPGSELRFEAMDARAVPATLQRWLNDRGARRIGINLPTYTPLASALADVDAEVVSLHGQLLALRFSKSEEELRYVRASAAVADEIVGAAADFVRPGRRAGQIVGDLHRLAIERGADIPLDTYPGSLNAIFRHNPVPNGYVEDDITLRRGDTFTLEVSPRVHGYYSQLTVPVSLGPVRDRIRRLNYCVLAARDAGLAYVRPGATSADAASAMLEVIAAENCVAANTEIGHLMGIALTEPRIGLDAVVEFVPGMTLVFHPIVRSPAARMFMRGDTYLVTDYGHERLNTTGLDVVEL